MYDDGYSTIDGRDVAKIVLVLALISVGAMVLDRMMRRAYPRAAAVRTPA